eukprot:NODE_2692_length_1516_cov_52.773869_g2318_i0.p1 GENE.NODE_2692_length_1516_cov_52.773869_g2318_i0~~NODE_2692_length_1516_cov_52.773869_g2318_i0.p1  ORF type:complete len:444 (+),score=85.40 NODE_2692_length_1516_cov_52.773869_g2318_i0:78-1334(+)
MSWRILKYFERYAQKRRFSSSHTPRPTTRQLMQLGLLVGVPMVGFGFVDNFIMIVAGDKIDATLGITMGLSTMAAAGLGNLISDVAGLGLGDTIERCASKLGIKDPCLSKSQETLRITQATRTGSKVIGITIGCLLGMCPLLYSGHHKWTFNENELELYTDMFQNTGVSPTQFYTLMQKARWHHVDVGETVVQGDIPLRKVLLIHRGRAESWSTKDKTHLYSYEGRHGKHTNEMDGNEALSKRGSIVGGSALVAPDVMSKPYPANVVAAEPTVFVDWEISDLKEIMSEDKALEAAIFSTLYVNLIDSLRHPEPVAKNNTSQSCMEQYKALLSAAIKEGHPHPLEKRMIREYETENKIDKSQRAAILQQLGWSLEEWEDGAKTGHLQDPPPRFPLPSHRVVQDFAEVNSDNIPPNKTSS